MAADELTIDITLYVSLRLYLNSAFLVDVEDLPWSPLGTRGLTHLFEQHPPAVQHLLEDITTTGKEKKICEPVFPIPRTPRSFAQKF